MAKKQKRSVANSNPARPVLEKTAQTPAARPVVASASTRTSYTQEFKPDYAPVISDLKKIAILAVSFISVLVVLSFFLR